MFLLTYRGVGDDRLMDVLDHVSENRDPDMCIA